MKRVAVGLVSAAVIIIGGIVYGTQAATSRLKPAPLPTIRPSETTAYQPPAAPAHVPPVYNIPPPSNTLPPAPAPPRRKRLFAAMFTCTRCMRSCYATWNTGDGSRDSFMRTASLYAVPDYSGVRRCPASRSGEDCKIDLRFPDADEVPAGTYKLRDVEDADTFF